MSTWLLIILFHPGTNAGMSITVQDLPTLSECQRVYQEIKTVHPKFDYYTNHSKCIEVRKK